jgi:hypothetical protein
MVAIGNQGNVRYPVKSSPEKHTIPGAKQLFRLPDHDVLGLATECITDSDPLMKPVILGGKVVETLPDASEIRRRVSIALRPWPVPGRRTELSPGLTALTAKASHV